jgi:hypothetical protein
MVPHRLPHLQWSADPPGQTVEERHHVVPQCLYGIATLLDDDNWDAELPAANANLGIAGSSERKAA